MAAMLDGDLFGDNDAGVRHPLGAQAWVLRGVALPCMAQVRQGLDAVLAQAPFRAMHTPSGLPMSVALTSCGSLGWHSDERGYRYVHRDPVTDLPWPAIPPAWLALALQAAEEAGFAGFAPDACLVNRYVPGARMSLHQDKNEADLSAPVVSVSLGMSAVFLWGGHARSDQAARVALHHGDVVVWGGVDRLRFHGVMPLPDAPHPSLGRQRINLTFRHAGRPGAI